MQTTRPSVQALERRWLLSGGDVDQNFGAAGKTLVDFGGMDVVQDLARARGGSIIAVGNDGSHIVLAKLTAAGKLDTKFADHGRMITAINVGETSLDVSPDDGRIAITTLSGNTLHVAMFDSDGDPIVTFATNGLYTRKSLNWADDRPRVEFNNGSGGVSAGGDVFVVAGLVNDHPNLPPEDIHTELNVIRLGNDGSVLATDVVTSDFGSLDTIRGLDGSLYLAFEQPHFGSKFSIDMDFNELQILRRLSSGAADELYGSNGRVVLRHLAGESSIDIVGMHAAADGSLTVMTSERSGPVEQQQAPEHFVYRLRPDGTTAAEPVKLSGLSNPTGFDVLDNGNLMVYGRSASATGSAWFAARFRADGTLDKSYGNGGMTLLPDKPAAPIGVVDASGGVVFAGSAIGAGGAADFIFERLQGGAGHGEIALTPRGTLTVNGTDDSDVISVTRRERDGRLVARVNDDASSFIPSRVKRIAISCNKGNDTVTIGPNVRGAYIDGGEGNDKLHGGGGGDFIIGGAGKDHLFGNDGNDTMLGGLHNDYLVGGAGHDILIGNGGVDTLSGGGGNDRLFGGGGTDHLLGGAGVDCAPADLLDYRTAIENILEAAP